MGIPVATGLWFVSKLTHMEKLQDEQPALLPCLMFNSETFMETNTHKKGKVGYLYKSQQAFKSWVVFLLVVGHSSLAFGLASSFKRRLSAGRVPKTPALFATVWGTLQFLPQHPANKGKTSEFAPMLNIVSKDFAVRIKHTHTRSHTPAGASKLLLLLV